jgi:chromosome segregation ATPase
MSNLLDFDIPPAPTPRSMPSITPRELESLKSNFLSEISSLKASLSGKEAEIQSLKTAVGDAEKRVGESLEQVREERNLKDQLAAQKEEWEKRGREMEAVLRNVKEEIVHGEREREDLEGRLDEGERRREAAEMMAQEAESKMAAMKAGKVCFEPNSSLQQNTWVLLCFGAMDDFYGAQISWALPQIINSS